MANQPLQPNAGRAERPARRRGELPAVLPAGYPRDVVRTARLHDGREVTIRPIVPEDADELAEAIRTADPDTLYRRFLTGHPPITRKLLERLTVVDYVSRFALVARDAVTGRGIGIARYAGLGDGTAEVAVAVDPLWRRVGLATELVRLLAQAARERDIHAFTASYLADNRPVEALLAEAGGTVLIKHGIAESQVVLDGVGGSSESGVDGAGASAAPEPPASEAAVSVPDGPSAYGTDRTVVVGVDGSEPSLAAVDLAATEAGLRRGRLRIVHAFVWPYFHVALGPPPGGPPDSGLLPAAQHLLAAAVDRARATAPDLPVTGEIVTGAPAAVLRHESRAAELVVIGDRGLGGFAGLLIGSVAVHLAAHAACPILVTRDAADSTGGLLLAADGSPANEAAVEFAFQEAALRGTELTVLHVSADADSAEARQVADTVACWQNKYPDLVVHRQVLPGPVRDTLIAASRHARLLVVGARGRGGFTGLLLGSVSQAVLRHAACPVAVLRHTDVPGRHR